MTLEAQPARRWRLVLGGDGADGIGLPLQGQDAQIDRTLQAPYDSDRQGGLGSAAPSVARWLGDIREYFPASVVQVMQHDAFDSGKDPEPIRQKPQAASCGYRLAAQLAGQLAVLGVPAFACTPDRFSDLMGAALGRQKLNP